MNPSFVSIIIPAYNCAATIKKTITAVLNQSYTPIELIVVDDGSKDSTAEIVRAFTNIQYIYQNNAGPAAARNRGAREAKGEIVFFTDSDCFPLQDWIETAMAAFKDQGVHAVAGSYDIANAESILSRCIHKEILFRHYKLMPLYPKAFGSYNVGIRKDVFEKVGGFNEGYRYASGEDNDLSYKILRGGYKIYFEKKAKVQHVHQSNLWKYLKEQYRHGYWRAKLYKDHPRMTKGDDYTFWKDIIEKKDREENERPHEKKEDPSFSKKLTGDSW